jgi:Tol biopolymer transport system component
MTVAEGRAVKRAIVITLVGLGATSTVQADRLVETRDIARGDFMAPRYSPDGRELCVSASKLRGLAIVPVTGGTPRALVDDEGAGVHARWNADGTIEYRAIRAGARRELVVDRSGAVRTRDAAKAAAPLAFVQDDRVYVRDRSGTSVRVGSGDRFFHAVVSPDGDKVAIEGLATGIHIYTRSTATLVRVGTGTAPVWSPDSARLVFERTEDDGHVIVASDLFVYHVAAGRTEQLTATSRIERRPSFSPDGTSIAFDDNAGTIVVGRLEPEGSRP